MHSFLKNQINNRVYNNQVQLTQYEKDFLIKNNCFLNIELKNVCINEINILNCTNFNSIIYDPSLYGVIKDLIYLTCKVNFILNKHLKKYILNYCSFHIINLNNSFTDNIVIRIIYPNVKLPYNNKEYKKFSHIDNNIINILDISINNIINTYENTYLKDYLTLNEIKKFDSDNGITIFINATEE